MSFKFNWRFFDLEDLEARCQKSLTESIASVSRPPVIVRPLTVTAIEFGTVPPELAFQSIPSVSLKRAHVVFALKYDGDASLTMETCIEANPFREPYFDPELPAFVQPKVVAATDSLILPFRLRLKNVVLDTLVDVVYTKAGVLVNFFDDPVKNVGAESSLDMIPGVKQLLGGILRQSITASFYEDVPESVWSVSNPEKRPPDPWFGARRWSQHNQKFVRFASFIVNSLRPRSRLFYPKFTTLALNVEVPELRLPWAILSRASLPRVSESFSTAVSKPLSPQGITSLFEAGSDTGSLRSSTATSAMSNRQKPRRRVISLRQLMPKDGELKEKTNTHESLRESTAEASLSNDMSNNVASEPRTPPVFASDDGVTDLEENDLPVPMLLGPSSHLSPPNSTQRRRFSTPDGSRLSYRQRTTSVKARTASMQPSTATVPLMKQTPSSPHAPPRSPRSRYVSTNDLMNK